MYDNLFFSLKPLQQQEWLLAQIFIFIIYNFIHASVIQSLIRILYLDLRLIPTLEKCRAGMIKTNKYLTLFLVNLNK